MGICQSGNLLLAIPEQLRIKALSIRLLQSGTGSGDGIALNFI